MLTLEGVNKFRADRIVPISWDLDTLTVKSGQPPEPGLIPRLLDSLGEVEIGTRYTLRIGGQKIFDTEIHQDSEDASAFRLSQFEDGTEVYTFPSCPDLLVARNTLRHTSALELPAALFVPQCEVTSDGVQFMIGDTRWELDR